MISNRNHHPGSNLIHLTRTQITSHLPMYYTLTMYVTIVVVLNVLLYVMALVVCCLQYFLSAKHCFLSSVSLKAEWVTQIVRLYKHFPFLPLVNPSISMWAIMCVWLFFPILTVWPSVHPPPNFSIIYDAASSWLLWDRHLPSTLSSVIYY